MRHLRSCISIFTSMGSCFKSLTAKSIFAAMLILFSSASMANNLVTDGTFDEATSTTWYGNAYNPVGGVNEADVGVAGNPWDVNLSGYVNVTAGADYTLSFDVSGADRTIVAGFGQSVSPYLGHTDTVNVSADMQTIVMHLTATKDGVVGDDVEEFGGETTRVIFDMGADTGAVSIDNVSLVAGHNGTETSNDLSFTLTVTAPGASMVLLATDIDGKTIGNPDDAYFATSNGDDTWSVVLASVPGSFNYQWVSDSGLDDVQWENLVSQNDSGLCEQENLVDSVAYRQWVAPENGVTESVVIDTDVFNTCNAVDTDGDGTADIIDNDDDNDGIEDANDPLPLDADANFTDVTQAAFSEAFGDTDIGDGLAYIHPADAQAWGGFANMNTSLYPLKLTEAGTVTFNASVPSGGDVNVRFRFEANAHPATEPSFDTDPVLVSGSDVVSYTINVPPQGSNTFNSLLMYLGSALETPDTDVAVVITDVVANVDADSGGGVEPAVGGTVTFSVDMTGVDLAGAVPTVEGSFNGYCGGCAEMSDENNDGVWLLDIELDPGFYTYVYKLDGAQEPLAADASCASVSLGEEDENGNQAEFINRTVSVDGDAVLGTVSYGGCAADYQGTGDTGGTDPVAPTIALPVDFEEAADAYEIAGFDGGVASVEAGPDGAVSLKYVKGAGQNWAGVWINLDTAVDAANGEIVTADVHSTVARDITLKFDAANVERLVSHTGSGWESLSFDFTGAMPADQTKIAFFNDLSQQGDGSADWTIHIDNLAQTSGGVAPEPGATIALPVDFEEAAADYEIAGFDGGVASVEAGPDGAVSLKYVKGAGQNWAGVWINLDTAVDSANGEVMTAAVHSTVARDITLKFDAANVERAASHTGSGWEALSFDFTGAMPADQTKIAFFNDLTQQGDGTDAWTIYIDNLAQTTGGDTGGGDTGGTDTGPKDVTFSVDMTGVDLTDGNPTLQSTFNNWCGACNPMSDDDGDNIWTVTVNIPQGDHEYKYALGAWVSQESVPADCDNTLGANRAVTVTGDVTLATDVYNGCPGDDPVGGDTGPKDVTFSVDMTGVDLTDGNPTLQSTFNNWCGGCNPMLDDDGDNIWTVTVNIPQGDHEYKYALGAWVSQESVPADCDNTLGANRAVTVTGDVTLATDVYNGCPGDDTSGGDTGGDTGPTIALPVDFEQAADAYEIAGFDGGVASVEAGPDGAVSLKYVKGTGANWAGVWINLDTAVDSANGEVMTASVHSTVARDITLKFDAANVERKVSHGGTGWEAMSFDFTGAMPADQTKIAFFNDLTQQGDGSDAWTIYIDNLAQTTGGVAPEPGATIALPVDFEEAAADYEIAGFDGGVASVEAGPDGAVSLKYVKGAGANWAGVWINLDTAVDSANGEVMTAAVHSTVARDITLKFDAANVERAASHTGSGWEALSFDFTGAMPADQTKIAFFNDLTQPGDGTDAWTIYIDNLAQTSVAPGPVDSDNDGVNDDEDAFPNDAAESADSDNDGVGDNADAFPNDASETADSDNDGVGDNSDYAPNDPAVQSGPEQSVFVDGSPKGMVGSPVSVTVGYDVSDADSSLTGLGLRVHYDSSVLTFVELSNVLTADNIESGGVNNDTDDEDGDASTDKYVTASWASLFGSWPGALPADLLTATFNVVDDETVVSTVINFSASSNAAGYAFAPTAYTLDILSGSFDFDGNGSADALTDGLMLLRYAFGLSGTAVTDGAIASDSPMTSDEVLAALETASNSFADIDGNGVVDALTDGLMLLRSLFGLTGDAVISGAVGNGATRTTAVDIEAYIGSMTP